MEAAIRELAIFSESTSLSAMIVKLNDSKLISKNDATVIRELLFLRNQIVHNTKNELSLNQSELRTLLAKSKQVISKMEKII